MQKVGKGGGVVINRRNLPSEQSKDNAYQNCCTNYLYSLNYLRRYTKGAGGGGV